MTRARPGKPRLTPKTVVFGVWFAVVLAMVVVPPVYLAAGRATPHVLGLPFSVFWMLLDAVLATAMIATLWAVESRRGEVERIDPTES
jgi:hypothetical protein